MSAKHILICHEPGDTVKRLRVLSKLAFPEAEIHVVDNLSRAYHLTEHHDPDCLLVGFDLAASSEFDLMGSLLRILKVGCVVFSKRPLDGHAKRGMHFPCHDIESSDEALILAIRKSHMGEHATPLKPKNTNASQRFSRKRILAIGASTGGIDALAKVLAHFDQNTPPTLIVQHTGSNFVPSMIRLLNAATPAHVKAAVDGETLCQGTVYFSPHNDAHLCMSAQSGNRLALVGAEPVSGHRPSIDMLFNSVKPHAKHVAAALLTGMGRDGAAGLKALYQAGSHTIGQDRETSVVYGMPRVAMEIGAVAAQLPIEKIGPALLKASVEKATT